MSPTSYVWVRLPPSEIALGNSPYFSLRKRSFIGSDSGNSDAKSRAASLSRSVARSTASLTLIWIFIGVAPRTPLAAARAGLHRNGDRSAEQSRQPRLRWRFPSLLTL